MNKEANNSQTPPEKNRYSQEELQEFKELILKKLESARKDLKLFQEASIGTSNNDTADTSPTFKVMEEGQSVLSKEENSKLAARQQKFIESLEMALVRIENGTYGICRKTGKLISKERLRSVPHATLSIEAKKNEKKEQQ
ncbi:MAG: TraR/DksA family transcriptional regulator [Bacteroidales bacterium]|jgi:DnaK suppressor protein